MVTPMAGPTAARRYLRRLSRQPSERARLRGRLIRPWRRFRFHHFGRNSAVVKPAWIYGPGHISIGDDVLLLPGCWLAAEHWTWGELAPALVIGDRVSMRMGCTLSAAAGIVIEDDVTFGAHCSVVDSDHLHQPHDSVLRNPVRAEPIRIGRGTWLGDGVVVVRGADIGAHCSIGANSVVRGSIPDHSVAVGVPARVVGTTRE
jgi:lipopolysaccharide O-acetyltransferase